MVQDAFIRFLFTVSLAFLIFFGLMQAYWRAGLRRASKGPAALREANGRSTASFAPCALAGRHQEGHHGSRLRLEQLRALAGFRHCAAFRRNDHLFAWLYRAPDLAVLQQHRHGARRVEQDCKMSQVITPLYFPATER
ncbi:MULTISPECIES: hypothetical protein [Rhodomicrobium]|uniref:hypothetical protein n=1 Tax=Rhodomicrobium TaxID=1068 RepID=UPI000F7421F3|nr:MULTISPECIES: hypothetical protein [Rhodomicrobium]